MFMAPTTASAFLYAEGKMDVRPVLIEQINIGERQREDVGDLADLSENIKHYGLLHPIVITRDSFMLMAGYRRLMACKMAGWTQIPCHFFEELTPREQFLIEFLENEKRQNLTWEEKSRAIQKYHFMCLSAQGREWTQVDTAADMKMDQSIVSRYLTVAKELNNPLIKNTGSMITAVNKIRRVEENREADRVYTLCTEHKVYTDHPIQQLDFVEWASTYTGPPFNLLHLDFPYGINAHRTEGQNSALDVDYTDTPETFWLLLATLKEHLDRICAPSAHMVFWFSPNIYIPVWNALNHLSDFRFDEHPLVWMRGENEGIAPDPNRRPRRVYEMAFFGWRGDRKIIQTKGNIIQAPSVRKDHPHEKSEVALRHYFEMLVNGDTRLLDPTCGSGSALRAAKSINRDATVFGLDTNPDYVAAARRLFDTAAGGGWIRPRQDLLDSLVGGPKAGEGNGAVGGNLSI